MGLWAINGALLVLFCPNSVLNFDKMDQLSTNVRLMYILSDMAFLIPPRQDLMLTSIGDTVQTRHMLGLTISN